MPALYLNYFDGYSKTHYKKLFTHVESHASAVSLLNSGEQRYIKAINNNNNNNLSSELRSCAKVEVDMIVV